MTVPLMDVAARPDDRGSWYDASNDSDMASQQWIYDLALQDMPMDDDTLFTDNTTLAQTTEHGDNRRSTTSTATNAIAESLKAKAPSSTKTHHSKLRVPRKRAENGANATSETPLAATTPLVSSRWENWQTPNQVLNFNELCMNTELEQRRERNRVVMRESRVRKKDNKEQMKVTLAVLEKQYAALCGTGSCNKPIDSTEGALTSTWNNYVKAVELTKTLGAEKLFLKATLQEKLRWHLQLRRILESVSYLETLSPDQVLASKPNTLDKHDAAAIFRFHLISEAAVKEIILEHTHALRRIRNQLVTCPTEELLDHFNVLGWDVRRRVEGTELEFQCVKNFPSLSIYRALSLYKVMETTWQCDMRLKLFQKINTETNRLDILQCINRDAYVSGRDVYLRDHKALFRSVHLRFRIEANTEVVDPDNPSGSMLPARGYLIGTQSINPAVSLDDVPLDFATAALGDIKHIQWADLALGMEFLDVTNPVTQKSFVQIRFTGKTTYKSELDAYRSAMDTMSTVLRWELVAIGPAVNILASSGD